MLVVSTSNYFLSQLARAKGDARIERSVYRRIELRTHK